MFLFLLFLDVLLFQLHNRYSISICSRLNYAYIVVLFFLCHECFVEIHFQYHFYKVDSLLIFFQRIIY